MAKTVRKLIELRIKEGLPGVFREVGGAADLEAGLAGSRVDKACYVFRAREKVGPNTTASGPVVQACTPMFGVVIRIRSVKDPKGGDVSDVIEALGDQVDAALLGYRPTDRGGLERGEGSLVKWENGYMSWQQLYVLPGEQKRGVNP